mmetsp:Transcript_46066/g.103793  ORF Transcript_46066/g.103793 Transcript_46066/m.103793 type:complete len:368 (+) Transcript_46066:388-1491(+)
MEPTCRSHSRSLRVRVRGRALTFSVRIRQLSTTQALRPPPPSRSTRVRLSRRSTNHSPTGPPTSSVCTRARITSKSSGRLALSRSTRRGSRQSRTTSPTRCLTTGARRWWSSIPADCSRKAPGTQTPTGRKWSSACTTSAAPPTPSRIRYRSQSLVTITRSTPSCRSTTANTNSPSSPTSHRRAPHSKMDPSSLWSTVASKPMTPVECRSRSTRPCAAVTTLAPPLVRWVPTGTKATAAASAPASRCAAAIGSSSTRSTTCTLPAERSPRRSTSHLCSLSRRSSRRSTRPPLPSVRPSPPTSSSSRLPPTMPPSTAASSCFAFPTSTRSASTPPSPSRSRWTSRKCLAPPTSRSNLPSRPHSPATRS